MKPKSHTPTLIPKLDETTQVILVNGQPLNAPYLRVFPTVPEPDQNNKNSSYMSTVNMTAPLNKGEEDDEFDKRRNNDQLVKVWPTTTPSSVNDNSTLKLHTTSSSTASSILKSGKFLNRKPVIESNESNKIIDQAPSPTKSTSLSQKAKKKNKSAVAHSKLATGRAAVDVACTPSNIPVNCYYGIFRCVLGKCTITSFDCGTTANKGRRVLVSQNDFKQFL